MSARGRSGLHGVVEGSEEAVGLEVEAVEGG